MHIVKGNMKNNIKHVISRAVISLFCLTLLFSHNSHALTKSRNLTIFAEPNMVLVMTKIAQIYSKKSNVIIAINFNPPSDSVDNIDLGEPADLFISAHPQWITTLTQKGLADVYNSGYVASDKLVLVTSTSNKNLPAELRNGEASFEESIQILNKNKATLILDYEGNSSGKFSNDVIKNHNLTNLQLFKKLPEDRSPILNIVRAHPHQYALLLASQVKEDVNFKILATTNTQNIYYQALVIAGDHMTIAREFLNFLKGSEAKEIFEKYGFDVDL